MILAKFIFNIIRGSFTNLSIVTLTDETRSSSTCKCLPAYLITLADKTKNSCLYYPGYILQCNWHSCKSWVLLFNKSYVNNTFWLFVSRHWSLLLNMRVTSSMSMIRNNREMEDIFHLKEYILTFNACIFCTIWTDKVEIWHFSWINMTLCWLLWRHIDSKNIYSHNHWELSHIFNLIIIIYFFYFLFIFFLGGGEYYIITWEGFLKSVFRYIFSAFSNITWVPLSI